MLSVFHSLHHQNPQLAKLHFISQFLQNDTLGTDDRSFKQLMTSGNWEFTTEG